MENRHQHEQRSGNKDGRQRGLPTKSQQLANRKGDEGILAHVRRDGEGAVGVERHEVAAEGGGQCGCHERGSCRNSRCREDRGIDYHNVRHRGKRGKPGDRFTRKGGPVASEIEQLG